MANLAQWYLTDIPKEIVDVIEKDLTKHDPNAHPSEVAGAVVDPKIRNSKTFWVSTANWLGGFLWYYVEKANRENFLYDITEIDGGTLQYTRYDKGDYYHWHIDAGVDQSYKPQNVISGSPDYAFNSQDSRIIQNEYIRKLSFSLILSDPEDYLGGELQFLDNNGKTFFAPKQKGTLIIFDSRTKHRVRKVREGTRKSLVGWVAGPRWL
jgi:PKHD-type hydroxylase